MEVNSHYIREVEARAEQLVSKKEVEQALDRMATAISRELVHLDPVVLCVMIGGVIPAGHLLTRLGLPLRLDYVHATRYRGATSGGELHWVHRPAIGIAGEHVLIIDDILDGGVTLDTIARACRDQRAASVRSAVLVEKRRERACDFQADFVGLRAPDRYLFGCGLDYKGYLRNAAGIYAVADRDL